MDIRRLVNIDLPCITFPQALYKIMGEGHSWIEWNKDGTKLRYNDPNRLMRELQGMGFKAQDLASLNKNFNDYGFLRLSDARKSRYDPCKHAWTIFTHMYFSRGAEEAVSSIRRRRVRRTRTSSKKSSPCSDEELW
ncbi:hypothetical protein GGI01_000955 [Coemansia sp. RSA 376]|nr:hypothetical protein GGI14_001776 [Coemansia sp. S680]KAJ2026789.1 hypothetical protein H4S03_008530 [Coemansia sp. S3946]KAJ2040919.1 hypothetical protein H4S04_007801 [Coemansia sp. S16]KAJ2060331.1 hypothetical protein GGH13_006799 [Coemansia sp. S155-1]KAJ2097769.1 hypothetical protein GGI16_004473 [Coemansia sp. S142-1]KAJ2104149.1 hypothetical protein IW146_008709 [Coemansia sp. RSA 922]KAJ2263186.1 hypothetical protein GGI01_000955 [Coemansia sp. RSA 376]KAJ2443456.1 hypothetical p